MSAPAAHVCGYCRARIVSCAGLPPTWGTLGGRVACGQCITLARVLAS